MKRLTLILPIALVAAAANAQTPPPGGDQHRGPGAGRGALGLIMFDANQDGRITKGEVDKAERARFAELDANGDGTATPEEMKAAMEKRRDAMKQQRFARLDKDNSGQLSEEELNAARDLRGDGDHKRGQWRASMREKAGKHAAKDGEPRKAREPLTYEKFSARIDGVFAAADANKDNVVTIAEMQAAGKPAR
ncbi:MAG: EF-hand domain-containing protein [Hyphomonadaceae bacterium]